MPIYKRLEKCYLIITQGEKNKNRRHKKMNYNMILTPEQWERLRPKMRAVGINYEPSGYGPMVYIGGTCSPAEYNIMAAWIEEL